jgi:hypothetical protein
LIAQSKVSPPSGSWKPGLINARLCNASQRGTELIKREKIAIIQAKYHCIEK